MLMKSLILYSKHWNFFIYTIKNEIVKIKLLFLCFNPVRFAIAWAKWTVEIGQTIEELPLKPKFKPLGIWRRFYFQLWIVNGIQKSGKPFETTHCWARSTEVLIHTYTIYNAFHSLFTESKWFLVEITRILVNFSFRTWIVRILSKHSLIRCSNLFL